MYVMYVYDVIRVRDGRARRGCETRGSERKNVDEGKRVKSRMEKKRERGREGKREKERTRGANVARDLP